MKTHSVAGGAPRAQCLRLRVHPRHEINNAFDGGHKAPYGCGAGFSGTGFCNTTGAYVQWTINASGAGTAKLTIRYANGTTTNRPMTLTVTGAAAGTLDF